MPSNLISSETVYSFEHYIESNDLTSLFTQIGTEIAQSQPENLIQHLIDYLSAEKKQTILFFCAPIQERARIAQTVAKLTGLPLLSPSVIVQNAYDSGDSAAFQAMGYINDGKLIPDELLNMLMKPILKETKKHGGLLFNFPLTRQQIMILKREKVYPDKLVFITTSNSKDMNIDCHTLNEFNILSEMVSNNYAKSIQRHFDVDVIDNLGLLPNNDVLDGSLLSNVLDFIYEKEFRTFSHPFKLFLCTSDNSKSMELKCESIGIRLASKHNLVLITAKTLIEYGIHNSMIQEVEGIEIEIDQLSSVKISELLHHRLLEKDARQKGFVVCGLPKNELDSKAFDILLYMFRSKNIQAMVTILRY
ncbi:hypothetical protein ROZALSC1DRAFT_28061 [Rozella allomycis CSF55]|uniref:Uncharacterized protein n=1 Tax=Rozella allomycis (strain CSF55) TaxID=988480 RepID=A0A075AMZ4_ROZAC|nr:hypothetical protein O9G_001045 [Rozella allomycis CSF55]RKP20450.1 hypothetical protein ROZALSC1DRAFT_28061 [Rozella allomycis CSF55]|eukprot:EPZ31134.1 hypothetical protein O9G_001045 [Rozella allomycis CSF55]